jgi:uncharacterized protein YfaQ (DUF2300 family)
LAALVGLWDRIAGYNPSNTGATPAGGNMNIQGMRTTSAVVLVLALAACGAATPVTTPAEAPKVQVPAVTPPAAPASAVTEAAVAAAILDAKRPDPPGFRRTVREGEVYFCQSRAATGSRARVVETCYTREEIERRQKNSDNFMKEMSEAGSHGTLATDSPN